MADDVTINWYRCPLDKKTLGSLTERSDWRGFAQIIPQLVLTVALGALAYHSILHWPLPVTLVVLYVYGTVYSFLSPSGAGHELCHRTVFKTRFWNELFLYLVSFLSWTNFVFFRTSHQKHHQYTVHAGLDLEVVQPIKIRRRDWLYVFTINLPSIRWAIFTAIRHGRGRIEGEWEHRIFSDSNAKGRRDLARWARVLLIGHVVLATTFIYFRLWPMLILVTFGSFYAGWLNFLCTLTQHTGLPPSVPDFRVTCRTVKINPLAAFLYWQMNYHVEHHMYAGVPFYRLAKLRRTIEADLPPAYPGLRPAWKEILAILRRQKDDPQYVFMAPVSNPKLK
jgi:fatty acid desaturase